jgi:endonuclease/exonuclease/phosphatase family metal-dependent hydrolase
MTRFRTAVSAVALAAALLASAGATPAPAQAVAHRGDTCGGRPCIQVGTFNIWWLGNPDPQHDGRRGRDTLEHIAALVADTFDLEVVVFQEIDTRSEDFRALSELLGRRGYQVRIGAGGDQEVVMAWDADEVRVRGEVTELPVRASFDFGDGCRSSNLRLPLVGTFSAGTFDFTVVGLHLKARPDDACSDRVRAEQVKDLLAHVDALPDRDVVLAGDFNAPRTHASIAGLTSPGGFRILTRPGDRAQASGWMSYIPLPWSGNIDHVAIRPGRTTEWVPSSTVIHRVTDDPVARERWVKLISDHAPVWTSFVTDGRDDDR